MNTNRIALIYGIVFLVVGVAGFIPGITTPHTHPEVTAQTGLGLLFGLFPVNLLHNIVHVLFGIWGVFAARSLAGARAYFKSVAIIYAILGVMGLIPGLRTTFGLIPLYGHDIWLHFVLAGAAAYFGFARREETTAAHLAR
jgi:hypothetical protein